MQMSTYVHRHSCLVYGDLFQCTRRALLEESVPIKEASSFIGIGTYTSRQDEKTALEGIDEKFRLVVLQQAQCQLKYVPLCTYTTNANTLERREKSAKHRVLSANNLRPSRHLSIHTCGSMHGYLSMITTNVFRTGGVAACAHCLAEILQRTGHGKGRTDWSSHRKDRHPLKKASSRDTQGKRKSTEDRSPASSNSSLSPPYLPPPEEEWNPKQRIRCGKEGLQRKDFQSTEGDTSQDGHRDL